MLRSLVGSEMCIRDRAALPPRPALVAIFLGGVKAPISGFVRGLSEIARQFVSVLDQVARSRASK